MSHFINLHAPTLPISWMVSARPRALHRFILARSLVASIVLVGCVPEAQYEEAQSAAAVAQEAERRTAQRLAAVEQELERLEERHAKATARLGEYDVEASEAAFERTHLEKQRDEHAELVTQLRGELARVGDHLRVYSEDRSELSDRLRAADEELARLQGELAALRVEAGEPEGVKDDPAAPPEEPQPEAAQSTAAQPEAAQPEAAQSTSEK